jgi:hypothetical protein
MPACFNLNVAENRIVSGTHLHNLMQTPFGSKVTTKPLHTTIGQLHLKSAWTPALVS